MWRTEQSRFLSPVRKFPDESLSMRDLPRSVVFVQDGDHLCQDCAELRAGDVAVFLQLGDEAHESGGGPTGAVISHLPLELRA